MADDPESLFSTPTPIAQSFIDAFRRGASQQIGNFIVEFSALENELRIYFAVGCGIDVQHTEVVTASIDFAQLLQVNPECVA